MLSNNSYYGNYRTRTFAEIYPDSNEFIVDYNTLFPGTMDNDSLLVTYNVICSRYMNSHIINSTENQFKYKLATIVFNYGPAWAKKMDIQNKLRNMSESDLITGSRAIHNHSYNPSTIPSTSNVEELLTIDDQNTQTYKKGKLEAYGLLWNTLVSDVTSEYLAKFRSLFNPIAQPDCPLWYVSEEEED